MSEDERVEALGRALHAQHSEQQSFTEAECLRYDRTDAAAILAALSADGWRVERDWRSTKPCSHPQMVGFHDNPARCRCQVCGASFADLGNGMVEVDAREYAALGGPDATD